MQRFSKRLYTAISIYVVGSKLQGYGTRPKGGMGRLELILGFRGCRREMHMEAENTISIALRFFFFFFLYFINFY